MKNEYLLINSTKSKVIRITQPIWNYENDYNQKIRLQARPFSPSWRVHIYKSIKKKTYIQNE